MIASDHTGSSAAGMIASLFSRQEGKSQIYRLKVSRSVGQSNRAICYRREKGFPVQLVTEEPPQEKFSASSLETYWSGGRGLVCFETIS